MLILSCGLLLAGCARPLVEPHYTTWDNLFQKKLVVAENWNDLAGEIGQELLVKMQSEPEIDPAGQIVEEGGAALPLGARPYYIKNSTPDMLFSRAFKGYLEQYLLDQGRTVSRDGAGSVVVNYRVEPIIYDIQGRRLSLRSFLCNLILGDIWPGSTSFTSKTAPCDYWTFWSVAGGIAYGLFEAGFGESVVATVPPLLALGPILDFLEALGDITNAEVILTVSVTDGRTIVYQHTETFYIEPEEAVKYLTFLPEPGLRPTGTLVADRIPVTRLLVVDQ